MKKLEKKHLQKLPFISIIIILLVIIVTQNTTTLLSAKNIFSESSTNNSIGIVQSVEPLKKSTTKQIPTFKKVCKMKKVPVPVPEESHQFGADNLIGAVIGGAIGSQFGDKHSRPATAAVGAVVGSEIVRNAKVTDAKKKVEEKKVCKTKKRYKSETIEKIYGYKLIVKIDDELVSMTTTKPYLVGEPITLRKNTEYFLD